MIPTVSICIPTFELGGRGIAMLTHLFKSIEAQLDTFRDFEVVVSDHTIDDSLLKLCEQWKSKFDIRYFVNPFNRGSCEANLNNAIKHARGMFIKPMLQDDFFLAPNALDLMAQHIANDMSWVAGGCLHCQEEDVDNLFHPHSPQWIPDRSMALGHNRIGSPSVVLYPYKVINKLFDHNLLWLMDCEFYYRLGLEIGSPVCIPNHLICIRFRHDSISDSQVNDDIRGEEFGYVLNKMDGTGKTLDQFPLMYKRLKKCELI